MISLHSCFGFFAASLLGLASLTVAAADSAATRVLFPPLTTTEENVTITIGAGDAQVVGRYQFRVSPDAPSRWLRRPLRIALQMPVLVSRTMYRVEDIEAIVRPTIEVRGQTYTPQRGLFYTGSTVLPDDVRIALFIFRIERDDLGSPFDVVMKYRQPALPRNGRDIVYYVPFLPTYAKFKDAMGLQPEAYRVAFESPPEHPIVLATPVSEKIAVGPQAIVVQPRHAEIIGVDIGATRGRAAPIRLPAVTSRAPATASD